MKHMKKLMALFAALALVLTMAIPAMAASGSAGNTGTITIDNAVNETVYNVYRIFDLESYDTDKGAYSYRVNNSWRDFVSYSTTIEGATVSASDFFTVNAAGYVEWNVAKKDAGAEFAKLAKAFVAYKSVASVAEQTASGSTVTFNGLTLGYYLVDTSLGSLCSLDATAPSVTIKEKNSDTTIEKKIIENNNPVDSNSAGIGDTVNFKTTITVKDGDPKNYVLHDQMTGLDFDANTLEIKNGSTTLIKDTDYTLDTSPAAHEGVQCTFHVTFKNNVLHTNDVVTVTYSAKVAANATIEGSGNPNKTYLKYGNKTTSESETKTYVWKLNVHKYTVDSTTAESALAGAKFILYRGNSGSRQYAVITSGKISNWVNTKESATVLTTPASGDIQIEGLDAGTYYLEETEAPKGYNKLPEAIEVTITATTTVSAGTATIQYKSLSAASYENAANATIKVLNNAGTTLPGTGGIGTTIFYVIGGGLMAAAAVLLVAKKRMENK